MLEGGREDQRLEWRDNILSEDLPSYKSQPAIISELRVIGIISLRLN